MQESAVWCSNLLGSTKVLRVRRGHNGQEPAPGTSFASAGEAAAMLPGTRMHPRTHRLHARIPWPPGYTLPHRMHPAVHAWYHRAALTHALSITRNRATTSNPLRTAITPAEPRGAGARRSHSCTVVPHLRHLVQEWPFWPPTLLGSTKVCRFQTGGPARLSRTARTARTFVEPRLARHGNAHSCTTAPVPGLSD